MKKIIAKLTIALSSFVLGSMLFAEIPEFKSTSPFFTFDAKEKMTDFKSIEALNKTVEDIEFAVWAYNENPVSKKDKTPKGWVEFSKFKLSDYNEKEVTGPKNNVVTYKASKASQFRYFAVTYEIHSKLKTKVEMEIEKTAYVFKHIYDQPIKPLASLEIKPLQEKDSNKQVIGIKGDISFRNISGKDISEVIITFAAYDNGALVKTQSAGMEEVRQVINESIRDGDRYNTQTISFWNDFAINDMKVKKVEVKYTDGSSIEY